MPCLKGPTITAPTLPSPLSLAISIPTISFNLELCCKLPPVPNPIPPIPIPPLILNPAIIAALNAYIEQAVAFINSLALECPLE